MRSRLPPSVAALAVLLACASLHGAVRAPKLIVLLMVDQFRGDYIDRFQDQWTHGLHRLIADGAWFRQARYSYSHTVTCAGHASVSTGAVPAIHGMILNGWWERESGRAVTCTDDDAVRTIAYGKPAASPGDASGRVLNEAFGGTP